MRVTRAWLATMAIGLVVSTAATLLAIHVDAPTWATLSINLGTSAAVGFAGGRLSRRRQIRGCRNWAD